MVNKYRNIPVVVDGVRFASKKEARRDAELQLLFKAKQINCLRRQPRYPLKVKGHLICTYVGDFEYIERGKLVCEDVKSAGTHTATYEIKHKLFKAIYDYIDHREV